MTSHLSLGARLEALYERYNRPEYIGSDPLKFVLKYQDPADREIAALIASACAFGNVTHICQNVSRALRLMEGQPASWLKSLPEADIYGQFRGWRHRWATGEEMANLLCAARGVILEYGSIGAAWAASIRPSDLDSHDTLVRWISLLDAHGLTLDNSLISRPERHSACKRLHLLLRWMVRCDGVDPGGWADSPARLLVPIDVHMLRISRALRFTRRRSADAKTMREVTSRFRRVRPDDPVRYDFSLTRLPISEGWTVFRIRRFLAQDAHQ